MSVSVLVSTGHTTELTIDLYSECPSSSTLSSDCLFLILLTSLLYFISKLIVHSAFGTGVVDAYVHELLELRFGQVELLLDVLLHLVGHLR